MTLRKHLRLFGAIYMAICCLVFAMHAFRTNTDLTIQGTSRDFKDVYAGARCLVQNCDPYDSAQLRRVYLEAGGPDNDPWPFVRYNANYPPSTLFLVIPIGMMPWSAANLCWLLLSICILEIAALLVFDLCSEYSPVLIVLLLGCFLYLSAQPIYNGQPSALAIGLAVIGAWCLLKNRFHWVGVAAFALGLALKPQIAALLWVYFLLVPKYRRRAVEIAVAAAVLMLPGLVWATVMPASHHWLAELHANLTGIAMYPYPSNPGLNNGDAYCFTNLQPLFAVFLRSPAAYNALGASVGAAWLLVWAWLVLRAKDSPARDLLALASMTCIGMLPIYHRDYDLRLLLLVLPAIALLVSRRHIVTLPLLGMFSLTMLLTSLRIKDWIAAHDIGVYRGGSLLRFALTARYLPLLLMLMAALLLLPLYQMRREQVQE